MTESAVAVVSTDLERIRQLGYWLSLSESGREDEKTAGASAALRIYYVEQMGLPPLATAGLSVIKGKVFVGGDLARALAGRAGYRVVKVESDEKHCIAALVNGSGEELGRSTFTIDDATRAGLTARGGAWRTYPARMLWQRASKYVIQDHAPEVLLGIYLDDEAADFDPPTAAAAVAEDGDWGPVPAPAVDDENWRRQQRTEPAPPPEPPAEPEPVLMTEGQRKRMMALFGEQGFNERQHRLAYSANVVGHPVESANKLTREEASKIIQTLETRGEASPDDEADIPF